MLDPYREVIKVTATTDSVFRLNINNSIVYTRQEVFDKVDAVSLLNPSEDELTRMGRWFAAQFSNTTELRHANINVTNLLQNNNSYSRHICGGIANVICAILKNYYNDKDSFIVDGHQWNCGVGYTFDQINKIPFYKDAYVIASYEELQVDKYLYVEPIRQIVGALGHYTQANYDAYITNSQKISGAAYPQSTIDSIYMRMPATCSVVLPVKSVNIPKTENDMSMEVWANAIMTIPTGVTGTIEMPFNLLNITGAGTVVVNEVTYNLPADEATLLAACQTTQYEDEVWIHGFSITANTGGLQAEFLVNLHRLLLYEENTVEYAISSGDISIEKVRTLTPVPTFPFSVDKGDNASFTLMYDTYLNKNISMPLPMQGRTWDYKIVYFLPNAGVFSQPQTVIRKIINEAPLPLVITAATPAIDQCWSAKLMPREETFADTLELSFTAVDESSTYYTIDESDPDATDTLYTEPFTISATTTVKWINIREGYANSHVNTRVITKTA